MANEVVVVVIIIICAVIFVVVILFAVELPQSPEDDPQNRLSCEWKANELITVDACVLLLLLSYHRRLRMTLRSTRAASGRRSG